jgi:hypothetical protein
MSNKFLGTTGAEIDVTNGTVPLYGSILGAKSLKPSYAVKTNSAGNLVSTKLFISDVENLQQKLNSVITNPYAGDLESKSFVSNNIYDTTRTSNISLSNDTINIISESVRVNGQTIITAGSNLVQNPMVEDLNCNTNNLTNIGLLNGFDIGTIDSDLTQVKDKTLNINSVTINETNFSGTLYANTLIKSGGTNQQYLMADGSSLQYSANSGNSNFYLYTSSQTVSTTPALGHINYNNSNQSLATIIYISHLTKDNIDIEIFFKNLSSLNDVYIQDQNFSESYIKYNITGTPTITSNSKVEIPVSIIEALGDGASSFGPNHPVLLSFFTNSIETDVRISNLETKTQNITGSLIGTDITNNLSVVLRVANGDFFTIRNDATPFSVNKFNVSNTSVQISSIPLQMNNQKIQFLATPVDVADATRKDYVDNLITPLQNKTANLTSTNIGTTETRYTNVYSQEINANSVIVNGLGLGYLKADGSVDNYTYLNTQGGTLTGFLDMTSNIIENLGNGPNSTDSINKGYVDTNFIKMVSNTFTASWGVTPNIITRTFTYKYTIDSTGSKIVTLGIPHIRTTITGGPLPLFSSTTNALPSIIRPATESISAIRIVFNNIFEFGYIALSAAGLISFARISSSWTNNGNGNGSGAGLLGDYMYITYVAA